MYHPVPAHRPVAGDDVFEDSGQQVPVVGASGREGRPVIEGELAFLRPHLYGDGESVDPLPEIEDCLLQFGEGDLGRDSPEWDSLCHLILGRRCTSAAGAS
jgi:hypothetical protein